MALPKHISVAELKAFERLQTPIWIYDLERMQMWWANKASLRLWNIPIQEELLNRNFSNVPELRWIAEKKYLQEFQQGKTITESWTFYRDGETVAVRCFCSGVKIKPGRMAMLVEGIVESSHPIEIDIRRTRESVIENSLILANQQQAAWEKSQRAEAELRWREALLSSLTDTSVLGFLVVDNRTDEILYFNQRFCKIWGLEHLETQMRLGLLKNNDIIPECIPLIADLPAFIESCKPLQSEENRTVVEDKILFVDGRTIRRFSSQIRDTQDQYFGRLYVFEDISDRLQTENSLKNSEQSYRSVITTMAEGIILQQADGSITACNKSAERILGLTSEQIKGKAAIDPRWRAIYEDASPFPRENCPALVTLRTGQPQFNVIVGIYKPDGSLTWISINSQPLFHPHQSKPYAVVASFTNITAHKQAELALQQQAQRERMIAAIAQHIRQSLDLEVILNTTVAEVREFLQTDRVIIYRFQSNWSGVVVTESVAADWEAILTMEITDQYFVDTQGKYYQQGQIKATSDIYTAGLTDCHVQLLEKFQVRAKLVVPILQSDRLWGLLIAHHCSAPRHWQPWESELLQQLATQLAIAIQQSELYQKLRLANQQLENIAMVDPLTQIANRRCFESKLQSVWQYLIREQGCISLLLCDVDYFKKYNDTYGHRAGDDCLRLVAQAFQQNLKRNTDLVARYGGEEFAVILPNTNERGAIQVAQAIHNTVKQFNIPHLASTVKEYVTLSIGIATVIPTADLQPLDLIEAADQALYQAKAQGRDRFCVNQIYA
ncbi:diguanylate cyclase domain-containing protein [Aulosira sp. FACHB-615]|uniref:sensor domain-containing diguanylate cyclase n=1 Tax=Aulosira sp. FACHB-615 TaxID=2692777 RepID=UPI0018EFE923|nr:diguanylate cyclase [Aulosira sp. FACHB-615]